MATTQLNPGSNLGPALQELLQCDEIVPGSEPSYQLCKTIFLYHPVGQKMTEGPVKVSQSLPRDIVVPDSPEDDVVNAFKAEWKQIEADKIIRNTATLARVYGIASLAVLEVGVAPAVPLDLKRLADAELAFNVLDPLNTAGSLVLNQDPNAMDFQKHRDISVQGVTYHRSRTITLMNEQPIYIAYTNSAFGFVGRSVYQRALFPLKTFVQTMIADDMVSRKVGLLVAFMKQAGGIVDNVMRAAATFKRVILQQGATNNVLSVGQDDRVESIDLTNLEGPLALARKDCLENIAAADDMPAVMLNSETFAEGFGEGTEDAKRVAQYCANMHVWMDPVYGFMDGVVQRRAWNAKFYESMQKKFPDRYAKMDYEEAYYRWQNSYEATWPSLLQEPESEQVRVAETKFKTATAAVEVMLPELDPENRKTMLLWFADTLNSCKELFSIPLVLDPDELDNYEPPELSADKEPPAPPPFSARDSTDSAEIVPIRHQIRRLEGAVGSLLRARR